MNEINITIRELAEMITAQLSFDYSTYEEARKRIRCGDYEYSFDATTLLTYENNLNHDEQEQLAAVQKPFFKRIFYREPEKYKELVERRILFSYIHSSNRSFKHFIIQKSRRPDFILIDPESYDKYGVEVLRLTTELEENLYSLSRSTFGKSKNAADIEEYALKHYKSYARSFQYYDLEGTSGISTGLLDIKETKRHYAAQLKRKFDKYRDEIIPFKEFIILGTANSGIAITCEYDVEEVAEMLKDLCPDINNVTIAILWLDSCSKQFVSEIAL